MVLATQPFVQYSISKRRGDKGGESASCWTAGQELYRAELNWVGLSRREPRRRRRGGAAGGRGERRRAAKVDGRSKHLTVRVARALSTRGKCSFGGGVVVLHRQLLNRHRLQTAMSCSTQRAAESPPSASQVNSTTARDERRRKLAVLAHTVIAGGANTASTPHKLLWDTLIAPFPRRQPPH